MKKVTISIVACFLSLATIQAQKNLSVDYSKTTDTSSPAFKWLTDSIMSLGQVEVNNPVAVSFEFINKGKAPLSISRVEPSCGCTSVEYTKEPIAPNQKGFVKAIYNAASIGFFDKTLTVYSNVSELSKVLTIKGEVVKK